MVPASDIWTAKDRARLTTEFVGMAGLRYYDVTVRIIHLADNAAVVADEGGMHRVILWSSMSYYSEHLARQSQGHIVLLKIRGWQ